MNAEITPRASVVIAMVVVSLAGLAYMVFLAATWNQYQQDRVSRDAKIDELLDRFPKARKED